jgi:hypothetical protein
MFQCGEAGKPALVVQTSNQWLQSHFLSGWHHLAGIAGQSESSINPQVFYDKVGILIMMGLPFVECYIGHHTVRHSSQFINSKLTIREKCLVLLIRS